MPINSLTAGMIFLMLWGRGIVRGRARRAGLLKATSMPKEKSAVDGFIHSCHTGSRRVPLCLCDGDAQAAKRQNDNKQDPVTMYLHKQPSSRIIGTIHTW